MIHLYLKIPEMCVRLILQDGIIIIIFFFFFTPLEFFTSVLADGFSLEFE